MGDFSGQDPSLRDAPSCDPRTRQKHGGSSDVFVSVKPSGLRGKQGNTGPEKGGPLTGCFWVCLRCCRRGLSTSASAFLRGLRFSSDHIVPLKPRCSSVFITLTDGHCGTEAERRADRAGQRRVRTDTEGDKRRSERQRARS